LSLEPGERETIVNACDADGLVRIWTAQRTVITRLRKDPAFTEIDSGHQEGTEWARFTIPADEWTPAGVKRKRNLSPDQRAQAAARARELFAKIA
jgi:hypothetical protein